MNQTEKEKRRREILFRKFFHTGINSPQPRPSHERNEKRERLIWDTKIQPVLDKCGLHFEYEFSEGSFTEVDIWKMTRLAADFCNWSKEFFEIFDVIRYLAQNPKRDYEGLDGNRKPLKDFLQSFLDKIINKDKTLPHFLELLSRENGIDSSPKEAKKPTNRTLDSFIRSLRFYYEDSSQIKIQEPGKQAKLYTYTALGFNDIETDEWTTFRDILQSSNTYCVGPAGGKGTDKKKEYDKKQGLLNRINKKLIGFLHKEFSLEISSNYKIYERDPAKEKGTYKFKFGIMSDETATKDKFDKYPKDRLLNYLKVVSNAYIREPLDDLKNSIERAQRVLSEKYGATQDEIRDLIDPTTDEEEIYKKFSNIQYDPHENIKGTKPDY